VTVVGNTAIISAGEWITASGERVNDCTHGPPTQSAVPPNIAATRMAVKFCNERLCQVENIDVREDSTGARSC
jgi:hypothetical protein